MNRMVSYQGLQRAVPYLKQEYYALSDLLENTNSIKNFTLVVIGGGFFQYRDCARWYNMSYILVEPSIKLVLEIADIGVTSRRRCTRFFNGTFEDYASLVKADEKMIYVFWFNVSWYILDIELHINKCAKPGDILFFSGWADTHEARAVQKDYFTYIYENSPYVIPEPPTLKKIDLQKIVHGDSKKVYNTINEVLIVYV